MLNIKIRNCVWLICGMWEEHKSVTSGKEDALPSRKDLTLSSQNVWLRSKQEQQTNFVVWCTDSQAHVGTREAGILVTTGHPSCVCCLTGFELNLHAKADDTLQISTSVIILLDQGCAFGGFEAKIPRSLKTKSLCGHCTSDDENNKK